MIEAQLRDAYNTIIVPFWRDKALPVSFRTKDALEIRGMAFPQPSLDTAIVISSGRTESFIKYKDSYTTSTLRATQYLSRTIAVRGCPTGFLPVRQKANRARGRFPGLRY
jgi:hypothetical protein